MLDMKESISMDSKRAELNPRVNYVRKLWHTMTALMEEVNHYMHCYLTVISSGHNFFIAKNGYSLEVILFEKH